MMSAENQQRFNQLEQALAGVHQLISQQMIANPNARSTAAVLASTESEEIEGLKTLSSSAKDIYFQLKTAAKQHAKRAA
ncbi:hypothetical protein [Deefgea sp. CFH1-16]|uniref:hypothetical protein n=1 Tax=Deefgea sp. CFH1-16 TaxID=2675457 RepID=UPI0015F4DED8|nr:hypothetical protein [Deefgea sp. CFH1-16]MBM5574151.1 hypothetical protein [Deefgea sp. CFH1-16]